MYVIPRTGFQVPDPAQASSPDRMLPAEGREVDASDYWTRRLRDGDVTEGAPPAPEPPEAPRAPGASQPGSA